MRTPASMAYVHMAQSFDALGETAEAYAYYQKAAATEEEPPGWGQFWLARFYADRNHQGSPYYQPGEAVRILDQLVRDAHRPRVKEVASEVLSEIGRTKR